MNMLFKYGCTLFKYGCRYDYQQFQYLCQCHPHLATGGNGGLPTAPVAPPRKRKVRTTSSGTFIHHTHDTVSIIFIAAALWSLTILPFVLPSPLPVPGMKSNPLAAMAMPYLRVSVAVLVASWVVIAVTDVYHNGQQAFQTQLSNTASPQVDAIVTALRQVYPRCCVVDRPVSDEDDKDDATKTPVYCVYMTADAPVPRRGQQITTGSQYLVIYNKYYGVTGYSAAALAIGDHDEVTPVTAGTCAPAEPLRCFAQRVVSGASCAAGAGINNVD